MTDNAPIVLVTGGSRGLGRNAALALARDGSDVIVTFLDNRTQADATVKEIEAAGRRAAALRLDTGDIDAFPAFVAETRTVLGGWQRERIDGLLNNAGMGVHAAFAETTPEQFDWLYRVHLKGVYFLTQALLPLIRDGGRIVNVSSGLARFSMEGYSAYAAMKGAVEVLTRYLAKELGARGIGVNVLAPGAIETDFGGGRVRDDAAINAWVAANTALGRAGVPDDIGAAAAALLSPRMGWVNGQRVEASGGMLL
ncbi:SDR family oxidoreductase [Luteimonas sp. RD2P54]|uniref:SDR family oxidoreductase n=1 Tax=Luteimonas endophytica TaxID=3042023 RepID=A0ABT6JD51_9GAMM|nr:SDR family oxidoreductase [Luteimonas endophytica]MDH5824123.1 SDR family oxidoreductase [Luteimonas endophytica]